MALDRQSIEKKDFPVGRRGYDPDAVDAHLAALADEVADYKRTARKRSDGLASSASDQVRSIIAAAESSAADIQSDADTDAREIREEANAEAQATREQATAQSREYVGAVSESTDTMRQRLEGMHAELDALIEALRAGSEKLTGELRTLESELTGVAGLVSPRPPFEADATEPAAVVEPPASHPSDRPADHPADASGSSEALPTVDPEVESAPVDHAAGEAAPETSGSDAPLADPPTVAQPAVVGGPPAEQDAEGARLIALNMALNGTPREEAERYLAENFSLQDADRLLDEVYASVDG